jgi:hypothetical protein
MKRRSRQPDLFKTLVLLLAVGMSLTLAYQINLYHFGQVQPMAEQAPTPPIIDG